MNSRPAGKIESLMIGLCNRNPRLFWFMCRTHAGTTLGTTTGLGLWLVLWSYL